MNTLQQEISTKKREVDALLKKATKKDTITLFTAFRKELDTISTIQDLDNKIAHVKELVAKANRQKTRSSFQVLLKELSILRKNVEPEKLVPKKKAAPVKKARPRKSNVPSPVHPIRIKKRTRKPNTMKKRMEDMIEIIKTSTEKKKSAKDELKIDEKVRKQRGNLAEAPIDPQDLFASEEAYERTQQEIAEVTDGTKKYDEGTDLPLLQRVKQFFIKSYEQYLVTKKDEPTKKIQEEEFQLNSIHQKTPVTSIFSMKYIRTLTSHLLKIQKNEPIGEVGDKEVQISTLRLEHLRRKSTKQFSQEKFFEHLRGHESSMGAHQKGPDESGFKVYEASLIGLYANQFCRQISFYLLKNFPDFFKQLYTALRLANIKVLSNTYVNIMVLSVILGFVGFGGLFFLIFLFKFPIHIAFARSFVMAFIGAGVAFGGMYIYPFIRLKERSRSITTNLPFAITNMAAVASAGVPPAKMFQLVMESKEYGEFSSEIVKVVEYTDLFGFDILTAIRSVSNMTPSKPFKEFFEGMINTIEAGGDLNNFLEQKSEELMERYELERKKYTESVATYSDIYTGILIAAPLFFVSALSLVSLLGGTVGGLDVSVLIVVGTYLIIPLMNVAFLIFLGLTQPDV